MRIIDRHTLDVHVAWIHTSSQGACIVEPWPDSHFCVLWFELVSDVVQWDLAHS